MSSKKPEFEKNDTFLDNALRPLIWKEYIGQKKIKENLKILLTAAKKRKHPPEHLLFYGPPGLGKTTLVHLIAREINTSIKTTSGPAIEKIGDLASILTNLSPGDILFVDEIHRLGKTIEEILYPAMESGVLDIIIGKGPSARTIQLELPPFTLAAATTRISLLSAPLRSRFSGGTFRLEFYTIDEIKQILKRSSEILGVKMDDLACDEIARRSRFTPRIANFLLKRCRDFAQVYPARDTASVTSRQLSSNGMSKIIIAQETALKALELLEIDEQGLSRLDKEILKTIITKFNGGPVGINTIATSLSEEEATIEEVNEPYLIQIGFLDRTRQGRTVTESGYRHLGLRAPQKQGGLL